MYLLFAVQHCTYRFLKGALGKSAGLMAVEALSGDGGQVTFTGHDLTQQHQVTTVHVTTIKRYQMQQFLFNGFTGSFDAQSLVGKKKGKSEEQQVLRY